MSQRILDVGQCSFDHTALRRLIEEKWDAQVLRAHRRDDTLDQLRSGSFALVLINRKLDADQSSGMEILQAIKADPALAQVPVMLVSNYPEFQQQAVAAGGELGFGKADLHQPETIQKLEAILGAATAAPRE